MLVTAITFDTLRIQGCAARNVHGFTLDEIKKMSEDWEEAPPLYLRLDIHVYFLPLLIFAVRMIMSLIIFYPLFLSVVVP